MICNYGVCSRMDTRPFKDGDRCPDHYPWKLNGGQEPPNQQLTPLPRKRRAYGAEYRKMQEKKKQ